MEVDDKEDKSVQDASTLVPHADLCETREIALGSTNILTTLVNFPVCAPTFFFSPKKCSCHSKFPGIDLL